MRIDLIAKKIVTEERRLPASLHVPIGAINEEAIETFVGKIVGTVSFRTNRHALLVHVPTPSDEGKDLPIWQLRCSARLHPTEQLWVHIGYTAYRKAYQRAFPNEDISALVLHHTVNRRVAKIKGFDYVRLSPITRGGNSSSGRPENWYIKLPRTVQDPRHVRKRAQIEYADLDDLLIIMGLQLAGRYMQVVNEAQYLVDSRKSPWSEDTSLLKQQLRILGESIPTVLS